MTMTDPVADMLTRIRNAASARHPAVEMPSSQLKVAIARVLKEEGYIKGFDVVEEGPKRRLRIQLQYTPKKETPLHGLKRVSKPGLRVYVRRNEIPRVFGGLGTAIVSTPRGVMSGDRAWRERLGGELLCTVW